MGQAHPIADSFALLTSGESPLSTKGAAVKLEDFCRLIQREAMGFDRTDRALIKIMLNGAIGHQLGGDKSAKTRSFEKRPLYLQTVALLEDPNLGTILDLPDSNGPHECGFVDPGAVARHAYAGGT